MDPRAGHRCRYAAAMVVSLIVHGCLGVHADYALYAANLHVHTSLSGSDHSFARPPLATVEISNAQQLDVVGLSDHDGAIDATGWDGLRDVAATAEANPDKHVTCVRGLEWTYGELAHYSMKYDHANIFGTANLAHAPKYTNAGAGLQALHTWLLAQGEPRPIVQFNHVWLGTRFLDFSGWSPALDACFRLIEVGGYGIEGYHSAGQSESNLCSALIKGWHVAPTIGRDNSGDLDQNARRYHTVIRAATRRPLDILEALRERRAYATEDRDLEVTFTCQIDAGGGGTHWMGSRDVRVSAGQSAHLQLRVSDPTALRLPLPGGLPDLVGADNLATVDLLTPTYDSELRVVRSFSNVAAPSLSRTVDLAYEDLKALPSTVNNAEVCLLVRVREADGDCAYTAPIWFSLGQREGLSAPIFVLDRSGSMDAAQAELNRQAEACVEYLMGYVSAMAVVNFNGTGTAAVDAPLTNDRDRVVRAIRYPSQTSGSTAIYEAVVKAVDEAVAARQKAMIILLTDGANNSGRANLRDAIAAAQKRDVPCMTVGFCSPGSQEEADMLELAHRTAGIYYHTSGFDVQRFVQDHVTFSRARAETNPVEVAPPVF